MYKDMVSMLNNAREGDYEIERFTVETGNFRAMIDGIIPGEYVSLKHRGEILMSDTPMEKRTNRQFVWNAHGDVLIGGLGLGMIVVAIQDNPAVKSITVLEKSGEVISLITEQISFLEKVKIIQADVFTWKPERGKRFDCIYMDIWPYINRDVYQEEMKPLKRKYGHYLKPISESPKRFNECWAEWHAKNGRRL